MKTTIVPDEMLLPAIKDFTSNRLSFEEATWDEFKDYFANSDFDSDFKNQELPSKDHLIELIRQEPVFQNDLTRLLSEAADSLIDGFERGKQFAAEEAEDKAEEQRQKVISDRARKKLLKSFNPEQLKILHDLFGISV